MKKEIKISIISVLVILIDQIIKYIIRSNLNIYESIKITKHLYITYVENTGGAFSILSGNVLFLTFIGFICLVLFYIFFIRNKELKKYDIIFYSIFIGGIIGNMIDRIINKAVIDYIDVRLFDFAIFNFADICIVISIILIIIRSDLLENRRKH